MSDKRSTESVSDAIHRILKQHEIQIDHPEDCLLEAEHLVNKPGFNDPELVDWQHLAFATIDNPDSRDLDQALLITQNDSAGYRVQYALADAAYYVTPGSALFREAMQRGVTYYTPLLAAPMLPPVLSEGLISLNPGKTRRALVFDMLLGEDGRVLSTAIVRATIKSQAKLSYESVQSYLDTDATHPYENEPWSRSLHLLKELGEKLIQRALDRDVIPFNRTEPDIVISNNRISLFQRKRVRTEKYNEQISLLCNMEGAQLLVGFTEDNPKLQAIFRAHDAPLEGRLRGLRTLIDNFVEQAGLSAQWQWHKDQSLAEYIDSLPDTEAARGKVLAIERQVLISNQASEYRKEPGRHHALAASSYARFSSPMREIVGIFTHKELLEALHMDTSHALSNSNATVDDNALRESIIDIANQSRQTQKQINKAVEFLALRNMLDTDLSTRPAPRRRGIVMGFRRDRLYVACEEIAVDLKVTQSDLEAQYNTGYTITELSATPESDAAPTWLLGDTVYLSTHSYDAAKNRYRLELQPS